MLFTIQLLNPLLFSLWFLSPFSAEVPCNRRGIVFGPLVAGGLHEILLGLLCGLLLHPPVPSSWFRAYFSLEIWNWVWIWFVLLSLFIVSRISNFIPSEPDFALTKSHFLRYLSLNSLRFTPPSHPNPSLSLRFTPPSHLTSLLTFSHPNLTLSLRFTATIVARANTSLISTLALSSTSQPRAPVAPAVSARIRLRPLPPFYRPMSRPGSLLRAIFRPRMSLQRLRSLWKSLLSATIRRICPLDGSLRLLTPRPMRRSPTARPCACLAMDWMRRGRTGAGAAWWISRPRNTRSRAWIRSPTRAPMVRMDKI